MSKTILPGNLQSGYHIYCKETFNSSTTIRFDIHESGQVTLKIFDLLGREVATLVNGEVAAGPYVVSWDASGLASGIYLYKIEAGDFRATRKLLLLK